MRDSKILSLARDCNDLFCETIIWYLCENRDDIDELTECLKESYCEMVEKLKEEIKEEY